MRIEPKTSRLRIDRLSVLHSGVLLGGCNREFDGRAKTEYTRDAYAAVAAKFSPTQASPQRSVAQFENNSADYHVFWTDRQKTMSAHPSSRAQEHRRPACVWAERSLRNSSLLIPSILYDLCGLLSGREPAQEMTSVGAWPVARPI